MKLIFSHDHTCRRFAALASRPNGLTLEKQRQRKRKRERQRRKRRKRERSRHWGTEERSIDHYAPIRPRGSEIITFKRVIITWTLSQKQVVPSYAREIQLPVSLRLSDIVLDVRGFEEKSVIKNVVSNVKYVHIINIHNCVRWNLLRSVKMHNEYANWRECRIYCQRMKLHGKRFS